MDTWYMTAKNYEEMRSGITTEVVFPYSVSVHFNLYAFHPSPIYGCVMVTPFSVETATRQNIFHKLFTTMNYTAQVGGMESSGIYTMKCIGDNWNRIVSVSLYIKFVKGGLIYF